MVEEKGPFVETLLKEVLYGAAGAPRIVGKRDEGGAQLLPREQELDADVVARAVAARLRARGLQLDGVEAQLARLDAIAARRTELPMAARTPYFCSGCPHNSSLKAPEGTLVGAGIGCHTMVLIHPEGKGEVTGITQMGGEGAQWIGQAPFTDDRHLVQNLGDGTFHHSGSLAIRAAVAAGVNITYKLLYNDHVAMTGGQQIEGQLPVPELTRWLELEGVRRVIVTADDTSRYRGVELAPIAELRERSRAPRRPAGAGRGRGRDGADPRPGVRRRAPPRAQARQAGRAGAADLDQRARLRGLRRLRARSRAASRSSRWRRSSAARRRSTRPPATRTTPASRATARRS